MRLIALPDGWEIDPEDVSAIQWIQSNAPQHVRLVIWLDCANKVDVHGLADATLALEAIRKYQAPEPEAVARTMTGLEDICRRVAALERVMEIDGAGIDLSKRLAAVDARLTRVEAEVFEPGEESLEPDGPKDRRGVAGGHWHLRTPPMPSKVEVDPDAPRRFRWPYADGPGEWHYGVYFPGWQTWTAPVGRCVFDGLPKHEGLEWIDPEPTPEPDGPKDRRDVAGDHWHLRTPPMLSKFEVDPDAPRRFRWPEAGGWQYGIYWLPGNHTLKDMLGGPCNKGFTWMPRYCRWGLPDVPDLEWLDPEPTPEPDGSRDRADIVGIDHFNGPVS